MEGISAFADELGLFAGALRGFKARCIALASWNVLRHATDKWGFLAESPNTCKTQHAHCVCVEWVVCGVYCVQEKKKKKKKKKTITPLNGGPPPFTEKASVSEKQSRQSDCYTGSDFILFQMSNHECLFYLQVRLDLQRISPL
jgi:hypothetical protein